MVALTILMGSGWALMQGDYHGAFVLDPDGNNIEACARIEKAAWVEAREGRH